MSSRSRGVGGVEGADTEEDDDEQELLSELEEEHKEGVEGDLSTNTSSSLLSVIEDLEGLTKTMGEFEDGRT